MTHKEKRDRVREVMRGSKKMYDGPYSPASRVTGRFSGIVAKQVYNKLKKEFPQVKVTIRQSSAYGWLRNNIDLWRVTIYIPV